MGLQEKILKALESMALPGARIEFETVSGGKIGAFLIAKDFRGVSQLERQRMVWEILEKELTKKQQHRIISVITLTPDEAGIAA